MFVSSFYNRLGLWSETTTDFGYDFWYQPRHNVMVCSFLVSRIVEVS